MSRAKLVGINHVALEVGDVEEAVAEAPLAVPICRSAGFARASSETGRRHARRQQEKAADAWVARG
jgi:hypothetical protein